MLEKMKIAKIKEGIVKRRKLVTNKESLLMKSFLTQLRNKGKWNESGGLSFYTNRIGPFSISVTGSVYALSGRIVYNDVRCVYERRYPKSTQPKDLGFSADELTRVAFSMLSSYEQARLIVEFKLARENR
jgi:hypothetical protein